MGYSLLMFILLMVIHLASTKPYTLTEQHMIRPLTVCETNDRVETICQICAKQTKSPIVYPMCCLNDEEALDWCESYIYFASKKEHSTESRMLQKRSVT